MGRIYYLFFLVLGYVTQGFANYPVAWQTNFQSSATPIMDKVIEVHDYLLYIIIPIGIGVCGVLLYVVWRFRASKNPTPSLTTHNTKLEVTWTLIPALMLLVLAFPSLRLIYFADKTNEADMTVKIVGRQWYWHYEYPDEKIEFDSTMIADKDIQPNQTRLLDVDHDMVIPVNTNVRLLATASDVIHSWAVPAFGVKQDTVPGRLKEFWIRVHREGTFYGQCSEICGPGHAYMPIKVRVVSKEKYKQWLEKSKQTFAMNDTSVLTLASS